jgi:uracil-DNA glycosylase family 4
MPTNHPSLSVPDEKALKALIAWWDEAGIALDAPVVRAKPSQPAAHTSSIAAGTATRELKPAVSPKVTKTATPAAAKAAGFGVRDTTGPGALEIAAQANTLADLNTAVASFEGCTLKRTARNCVFARGNTAARIMIVGEAPGREEDDAARPFVGPAGQLLDKMFAAIGLDEDNLYITNIVNWRPPGNRNATQEEISTCLPLVERHIALVKPEILIIAGGLAAQALLRTETGIAKLRGDWTDYRVKTATGDDGDEIVSALPFFHPNYLLNRPAEKRQAWRDLLKLKKRLTLEAQNSNA